MPSPAAASYKSLSARSSIILRADRSVLGRREVQALYGAAFVAQVAAWNAYVARLPGCFFQEVSNPAQPNFHALHTLVETFANAQLDRFNTPNAENTRNLIIGCTGYDPWPDWLWPAHAMTALAVRERLNEILKVRHSLAHGFAMPGYMWTQGATGQTRLTLQTLSETRAMLNHLVLRSDQGLRAHMIAVYGVAAAW